MYTRFRLVLLFSFLFLYFTDLMAQPSKKEFRGVWITTVYNIDWPSRPGLSSAGQQAEFIGILKQHKARGMNAVVVQVRPAADAFYPSRYEPWSHWLTGEIGKPPYPYYDPLQFMIRQAHALGMEFHAWFNPYRGAVGPSIDSTGMAFQHPEWILKYGNRLYVDPGLPEAQQHVTNVVMDVVNHYDVDGVHFDDYFYPYPIDSLIFPDSASYKKYGQSFTDIGDWRRSNVDKLIRTIHDSIQAVKPYVKFGVSPFAVWRNKDKDPAGSNTHAGVNCYDDLYADVLKWLREGWIDYIVPQIYWSIGFEPAPYEVLADWWNRNSYGKPVYVGQAAYRINTDKDVRWKEPSQMPRQLRLNRQYPNIQGSIFFNTKSFKSNPLGIDDSLKNDLYKFPALIPSCGTQPVFEAQYPVMFSSDKNGITLQWQESIDGNELSPHVRYVIYRFDANEKIDLEDPKKIVAAIVNTNPFATGTQYYTDSTAKRGKKYLYVVTGINRKNNESRPTKAFAVKSRKKYWNTYEPVTILAN